MRIARIGLLFAALAAAQNPLARPDPFVGIFEGQQVVLELKGAGGEYTGTLVVQGQQLPAAVKANGANGSGAFTAGGQNYGFTLSPTTEGWLLTSEGAEYRLVRRGGPVAPPPVTPAVTPGSIVGMWRNSGGYAKFNADGTGIVDGAPGRYEVRGNQLTLIGAQGQATVPFEIQGDTLTMTVNGQQVSLTREKELPPGKASVRMELVGKWCWVSVVNAQQGARQSNRCLTLNGDGSYIYEGLTDSYNPYGGATSQSRDVGTWEATENSLTEHSRSGRTVTYRLEKRNHPKNVRDPMIVLDGQAYVTFYNKAPW